MLIPFCFSSWTEKKNTILHWAQIVAVLTTVNYVSWFSSGRNWAFKHKPSNCASIVHSLMSMRKSSFSVNQDPSQRIPSSHFWACEHDNTSLSFEIFLPIIGNILSHSLVWLHFIILSSSIKLYFPLISEDSILQLYYKYSKYRYLIKFSFFTNL